MNHTLLRITVKKAALVRTFETKLDLPEFAAVKLASDEITASGWAILRLYSYPIP